MGVGVDAKWLCCCSRFHSPCYWGHEREHQKYSQQWNKVASWGDGQNHRLGWVEFFWRNGIQCHLLVRHLHSTFFVLYFSKQAEIIVLPQGRLLLSMAPVMLSKWTRTSACLCFRFFMCIPSRPSLQKMLLLGFPFLPFSDRCTDRCGENNVIFLWDGDFRTKRNYFGSCLICSQVFPGREWMSLLYDKSTFLLQAKCFGPFLRLFSKELKLIFQGYCRKSPHVFCTFWLLIHSFLTYCVIIRSLEKYKQGVWAFQQVSAALSEDGKANHKMLEEVRHHSKKIAMCHFMSHEWTAQWQFPSNMSPLCFQMSFRKEKLY